MKNLPVIFLSLVFLFSLTACNLGKKNTKTTEPEYVPVTGGLDKPQGKAEELTVWIGPKIIEAQCGSPMAPPSCREERHQAQYGELDKNGDWKPMYDFYRLPDYEEGYIYHVKYTKVHFSDEQLGMLADHQGYEVSDFVVLSKEKI